MGEASPHMMIQTCRRGAPERKDHPSCASCQQLLSNALLANSRRCQSVGCRTCGTLTCHMRARDILGPLSGDVAHRT